MAAINYEVEYDNRARVPEHVEIFARWHRDAEAYRAQAKNAALGLSYGPSPRQTIDIFPAANDGPATPLALFMTPAIRSACGATSRRWATAATSPFRRTAAIS